MDFSAWLGRVLAICAAAALINVLAPSGKIKNAVNFVAGLILMLVLVEPIGSIIKGGISPPKFDLPVSIGSMDENMLTDKLRQDILALAETVELDCVSITPQIREGKVLGVRISVSRVETPAEQTLQEQRRQWLAAMIEAMYSVEDGKVTVKVEGG